MGGSATLSSVDVGFQVSSHVEIRATTERRAMPMKQFKVSVFNSFKNLVKKTTTIILSATLMAKEHLPNLRLSVSPRSH